MFQKVFLQNLLPLYDKSPIKSRDMNTYLSVIKVVYCKPIPKINLNEEKVKNSSKFKNMIRFFTLLSSIVFQVLVRAVRQLKEIK